MEAQALLIAQKDFDIEQPCSVPAAQPILPQTSKSALTSPPWNLAIGRVLSFRATLGALPGKSLAPDTCGSYPAL
ncbi:hypothetical protein PgNI_11217 [Pyricularia grisea]|uniref:Uncharacterized protein n=1 Tax=Pyricularia grisea TaxID=148305 RepID=A0A6P8APJ0_PYRGI|nr:hypothetical protein PgNI_11217 [Pyricularia grisea]TLD03950.1 hypothetical protein PgNI_11217 [Pyricularia grisea]